MGTVSGKQQARDAGEKRVLGSGSLVSAPYWQLAAVLLVMLLWPCGRHHTTALSICWLSAGSLVLVVVVLALAYAWCLCLTVLCMWQTQPSTVSTLYDLACAWCLCVCVYACVGLTRPEQATTSSSTTAACYFQVVYSRQISGGALAISPGNIY